MSLPVEIREQVYRAYFHDMETETEDKSLGTVHHAEVRLAHLEIVMG